MVYKKIIAKIIFSALVVIISSLSINYADAARIKDIATIEGFTGTQLSDMGWSPD